MDELSPIKAALLEALEQIDQTEAEDGEPAEFVVIIHGSNESLAWVSRGLPRYLVPGALRTAAQLIEDQHGLAPATADEEDEEDDYGD